MTAFNAPVFQSYPEITAAVRQHLGAAEAELFARPAMTGGQIAWTTDLAGPVRHWTELAPSERTLLEPMRRKLGSDLTTVVGTLRRGGLNTKSGNLSHLLETALVVPDAEHLWLVGDRFVLTFWGFRKPGERGLDPLGTEPLAVPPPPLARRRRLWPWLLALLALLLLAVLALVFWWPYSVTPAVVSVPKPAPVVEPPKPEPEPPAVPPEQSKPPEPAPPEPKPLEPEPAPAPPPPPEPPVTPPPPAVKPPDPAPVTKPPPPRADLPKQRWEQRDLTVLEGCWTLGKETPATTYNMFRMPTESGVTRAARLCLDQSGRGRESIVSDFPSGRVTCDAPITAAFGSAGELSINRPSVKCNPPRTSWLPGRLSCSRRDDSVAICTETGEHGSGVVEFRRAR